jgi:hypothetical protein
MENILTFTIFVMGGFIFPFALLLLLIFHPLDKKVIAAILHHRALNYFLFIGAMVCFFHKMASLGNVDFGNHRQIILRFFYAIAIAALFFNHGLLGVRGVAILELLWANRLLRELIGCYQPPLLILKGAVYGIILLSFYMALEPYHLRVWLLGREMEMNNSVKKRRKIR